jgi:glycosyltransferase 2 family protein
MAAQSPRKSIWHNAAPRVVVSLVLAGGFVWLLARGGLPLLPPLSQLANVPSAALLEFAGLSVVSAFLRTYRWNYLVRPIAPTANPVRIMSLSMVGFSAVFLLPLRSGEIVRPYLLARDGELSFMQAAGTVGAERVIDGLVLTSFTFVALTVATPISPLPSALGNLPLPIAAVPAAVYSALLVFGSAFVAMTAFYVARAQARRLTERVIGLVSQRAAKWAAGTLERIADGLSFLPSKSHLLRFLAATVACWGTGILAQWLLLRGLGLPATIAQATTTVGVQGLGTLVPAGPGMFGAFQIAGFSALAMFFPMAQVKSEGALFLFLTYSAMLLQNVLQLVLGLLLMAKTRPASPPAPGAAS